MCKKCEGVLRDGHGPLYSHLVSELVEMDTDSKSKSNHGASLDAEYELFRRALIVGLQGFIHALDDKALRILTKKHPDLWKAEVEDWFVREGLVRIPEIVDRFLRLSPIVLRRIPNHEVEVHLREATRCFLYGFFQGSTVLTRAAIEAALNDCLAKKFGSPPECGLSEKIRLAARFSLLEPHRARMARHVVKAAGKALHEESVKSSSIAFDAIVCARGVLQELYGQ